MARDMNMPAIGAARALRWWTPGALNTLAMQVMPALSRWAQAWGVEVAPVRAFNACEVPAAQASTMDWQAVGTHPEDTSVCLWAGASSCSPAGQIADAVWGTTVTRGENDAQALSSPLAATTADRAWKALLAELAGPLKIGATAVDDLAEHPAHVPGRDLKAWSGAVQLQIRFAGAPEAASIWLHLSPALAQALCLAQRPARSPAVAGKTKLVPLKEAVASRPLRFSVELDPTELKLGDLQSLRIGDVLTLPHRLDSPLTLRSLRTTDEGQAIEPARVGLAYLGARQGQRAIEILRTDSELA
jgi:flagellar motor switch/type III secretory pathway protein FliN